MFLKEAADECSGNQDRSTPHTKRPQAERCAGYFGRTEMNILLADMFALYLKTKNFHWHLSGPHFRDYDLLLDEQGDQIFATTDAIAERVRKIGAQPCTRSGTSAACNAF
jgi:Ferritin-like domain